MNNNPLHSTHGINAIHGSNGTQGMITSAAIKDMLAKAAIKDMLAKAAIKDMLVKGSVAEAKSLTPQGGESSLKSIPVEDPANHQECVLAAIYNRMILIIHLETSLRSGRVLFPALPDDFIGKTDAYRDTIIRDMTKLALMSLSTAELVLWRDDLLQHVQSHAEGFADTVVTEADLPRFGELWFPYGKDFVAQTISSEEGDTYGLLFDLLLPYPSALMPSGEAGCLMHIGFFFPAQNGAISVIEPPKIFFENLLNVGECPATCDAKAMLASLTFRASTIVSDDRLEPTLPRVERRRMERAGISLPVMRIVNLRRKEASKKGNAQSQHKTESQYNWQWYVRPHVRKPNARMKEQRPIWVAGYIKGPKEKPLKPLTPPVNIVNR